MVENKCIIKKVLFLGIVIACLPILSVHAQVSKETSLKSQQILKNKGKIVAAETEKWQRDEKDIPKGWVNLKNKFFSVTYPSCFDVEGEGGEDDVKLAPSVQFARKESCPGCQKNFGDSNSIGIGIESGLSLGTGPTLEAITESDTLFFQNLIINGVKAKFFVMVENTLTGHEKETSPQLRWKIYIACNKNILSIASRYPMGKISEDRINKNDYVLPEDFKAIAGTFRCGSVPYWTPPK